MKKVFTFGALLTIIGITLFYLLWTGRIRFNYPDKERFPIVGIDVSHHQGEIRWPELRKEKISFIIIKATEGGDYKDPMFDNNWSMSRSEGYKTGAYHFYRLCKGGREQATNFIDVVPSLPDNLPPTIDLEFGGNCKTDKTTDQLMEEVSEFLKVLEDHYGKRPIIYATQEFYDEFLSGRFQDYPIWIRDIFREPELSDGREWLIWQFANRAHLDGIDTYVDLNVLNGRSVEILSTAGEYFEGDK